MHRDDYADGSGGSASDCLVRDGPGLCGLSYGFPGELNGQPHFLVMELPRRKSCKFNNPESNSDVPCRVVYCNPYGDYAGGLHFNNFSARNSEPSSCSEYERSQCLL